MAWMDDRVSPSIGIGKVMADSLLVYQKSAMKHGLPGPGTPYYYYQVGASGFLVVILT